MPISTGNFNELLKGGKMAKSKKKKANKSKSKGMSMTKEDFCSEQKMPMKMTMMGR